MAVYFRKISNNGNSVVVTDVAELESTFVEKKFGNKTLRVYTGSQANQGVRWGIIAVAKEDKKAFLDEARKLDPGTELEGFEFTDEVVEEGKPVLWVV